MATPSMPASCSAESPLFSASIDSRLRSPANPQNLAPIEIRDNREVAMPLLDGCFVNAKMFDDAREATLAYRVPPLAP